MNPPRQLTLLLIVGGLSCAAGCTSPKMTFVSARCEDAREGKRLTALAFVSTLETRHLKGEQLIYRVRLFARDRRPLRSRDGHYQTSDGTVAATTTLMVLQSPQTFEDVRVTIPARELGVPPNAPPAIAEIAVYKAEGELAARVWRMLPPLSVAEIMPPLTTAPAPVPYWFVKVTATNRLPTLLGPFSSREEAQAAVTEGTGLPKQIHSNEYLWFVPFHNPGAQQRIALVGPCSSEKDAQEIVGLIARTPTLAPKGWGAGAPIEVQLGQWLKEREVSQILSSRPAGAVEKAPVAQPQRRRR